ncbi:hypothetical protein TNCV_2334841 [Trichonephila clavipes]|uniref:Uncharacterized protein n=1 Tax=Trichonephila clavipes TaxID=2585209 RepID=A0A8X6VNF5_TRICX|nr:hypothetical protein TNCV_2334841 [Trichonephila clavipes]
MVLARFRSGNLRSMTFVHGVKSFFTCLCSPPASPAHILVIWGISLLQLYEEQDLVYIACYNGNPCNQGLVGVYGTCVNKTLHMAPGGRNLGRRGQASVSANLLDHPVQSIGLDRLYPMHFAHLH